MFRATVLGILCFALASCAPRDGSSSTAPSLPLGNFNTVHQPQPAVKKTAALKEKSPETKEESPETHTEAKSAEKDGVRLTVRVPKTAVAGNGLPIQVKLVNNGEPPRFFHREISDPTKLWLQVTTKQGKTVPFTLYGKRTYELTGRREARTKKKEFIGTIKLVAGQVHDLSVPNLALLYDLTVPGEYALTVSGFVQASEEHQANKVKFQVEKIPFTISRGGW